MHQIVCDASFPAMPTFLMSFNLLADPDCYHVFFRRDFEQGGRPDDDRYRGLTPQIRQLVESLFACVEMEKDLRQVTICRRTIILVLTSPPWGDGLDPVELFQGCYKETVGEAEFRITQGSRVAG